MAVLAIDEPVRVEKTAPPATVRKHSRPGNRPKMASSPSKTLIASPVWKNSEPIMMNMGTGPSVNRLMSSVELSATWIKPAVPEKMMIARKLVAMNENATGTPSAMKNITMPSSRAKAQYHSMATCPL